MTRHSKVVSPVLILDLIGGEDDLELQEEVPLEPLARGCSSLITECRGQDWQWSVGWALLGMVVSWSRYSWFWLSPSPP